MLDGIAPGALTLVVLMGVRTRGESPRGCRARLVRRRRPRRSSMGASHDGHRAWIGTLATLGEAVFDTELPGVLVIGEVVSLASQIATSTSRTVAAARSL